MVQVGLGAGAGALQSWRAVYCAATAFLVKTCSYWINDDLSFSGSKNEAEEVLKNIRLLEKNPVCTYSLGKILYNSHQSRLRRLLAK